MKLKITALSFGALLLTGCANTFNTAENSSFGCGLPQGQTCKTPTAVYNSTHSATPMTEYDTPVVNPNAVKAASVERTGEASMVAPGGSIYTNIQGPRPVRQPAQIVRIWIAPWVDAGDNLNLAQYQFAEVQPRTWTVGVEETKSGGYVIPHLALTGIGAIQGGNSQQQGGGGNAPGALNGQNQGDVSSALESMPGMGPGTANTLGGPR